MWYDLKDGPRWASQSILTRGAFVEFLFLLDSVEDLDTDKERHA